MPISIKISELPTSSGIYGTGDDLENNLIPIVQGSPKTTKRISYKNFFANHEASGHNGLFTGDISNNGKYLKTEGGSIVWSSIESFPSLSGNSNKFLKVNSDETAVVWSTIPASSLISPLVNGLIKSDGTNLSAFAFGSDYQVLTSYGSLPSWVSKLTHIELLHPSETCNILIPPITDNYFNIDLRGGTILSFNISASIVSANLISDLENKNGTSYTLLLKNTLGSAYTLDFNPSVKWANGISPTPSAGPDAIDIYVFVKINDLWYGQDGGRSFA